MSYSKAEQLLQLATLVSSSRNGLSLEDIGEFYSISHRTAQRMAKALEKQFPEIESFVDDKGRKRLRLVNARLWDLISISADELSALEYAAMKMARSGLGHQAKALKALKEKVISLIPRARSRIEPDYEALLHAQGFVAHAGPRPKVDEDVHFKLIEAIKACRFVDVQYKSKTKSAPQSRRLAPYGFLSGMRLYLIAAEEGAKPKVSPKLKTYRLDSMLGVKLTAYYFVRPDNFSLQEFANTAFGVFQKNEEYGEVVWKFAPEAAEHAASYLFHPSQVTEIAPDGSLIVKFKASGHLEMAWHLYTWGNKVEVLHPPSLKKMVDKHKRSDFPTLP